MEVDAAMYTTHPNTQDKSRDNQNAGLGEPFVQGTYLNSLLCPLFSFVLSFTLPETCSNGAAAVCSNAARQLPRNTSQGSYT